METGRAPLSASPLWVISLFIALCEVVVGFAVVRADGLTRATFTVFAVSFPIAVFSTFVWLLVKHSDKIYSPGQYKDTGLSPAAFAEARVAAFSVGQRAAEDTVAVYTEAVSTAVANNVGSNPADSKDTVLLSQQIVDDVRREVEKSSVKIDLRLIEPDRDVLELPVTRETTVQTLLDTVYFAIADWVEPYRYNETWVLASGGKRLTDIGTAWATLNGLGDDRRQLAEAGISLGQNLTVVPLLQPIGVPEAVAIRGLAGEERGMWFKRSGRQGIPR